MTVLGIDPSLTSTGYACRLDDELVIGMIRTGLTGVERLNAIHSTVDAMLRDCEPSLIVMEGYAMGRFAGRAFDLGELGGVLKLLFWKSSIRTLIVPPTCLKLFATGKGNADKDTVRVAMAKDRGKLFKSDDESDAYCLLRMGESFLDRRELPRNTSHFKHKALAGCMEYVYGNV